MYYSAWDKQNNEYFHTGRNSKTKKECQEDISTYLIEGSAEDEAEEKHMYEWTFKEIESFFEIEIHKHNKKIGENMRYTKGPWKITKPDEHGRIRIIGTDGSPLYFEENSEKDILNLIMATPELLEACKKSAIFLGNYLAGYDNPDAEELLEKLNDIIDKAERGTL